MASLLDYAVGDPWEWPHPVRFMGWVIKYYTQIAFRVFRTPVTLRWAGALLCIGLLSGSALLGWLVAQGARVIHPVLGIAVESIMLATCFAGRSLRAAAEEVLDPLEAGDLAQARLFLSRYVGRDTNSLSKPEILRAVLETVTENATDGVLAPLFYALVGLAFPRVGSVPLAFAYKAASTLDSTIGYREAPYTDIGWFSARVEDTLTWLPCRLSVATLAIFSGEPCYVWQICQRDAKADPSPNAGWIECAYAAILGVQMGGTNWYQGIAKQKPLLGNPTHKITPVQIYRALRLTRYSFLVWLLGALVVQLL
ncbi:MAG TPA: adenosylcobinamide-phosphate synthase CbiB [Candidatus Caenarcaniphilales bacterium]